MDTLRYCSAMCKVTVATRLCTVLAKLLNTRNFLDGPFGILMRFRSRGRQSIGKFVAYKHPEAGALTTATSLERLSTFMTRIAAA